MNKLIRENTSSDRPRILEIWEASVRATHQFLSEEQILEIKAAVKSYANEASFLVVSDHDDDVYGFMGMTGNKIDSLFIDPAHFGKSFGKLLVQYAFSLHSELYVDVNEDNPGATLFYKKMGFQVYERTDVDDAGRPFPILKMRTNFFKA